MIVAVTGGTGFLGRRIVAQLRATGIPVRMLARRPWATGIPRGEGIATIAGSLEDANSLKAWIDGATHVIHSAASVGSVDPELLRRVNVEGTRNVLAAAEAVDVKRFVHVSSIAAEWRPEGLYGSSKRAAEAVVEASDLPWVMLRPPVIVGPGSQVEVKIGRFGRFGVVPTVAGAGRMHPVHVEDVAAACVAALDARGVCGRRYELPGPEQLTLPQIQRRTLSSLGKRAVVVPIPPAVLQAVSAVLVRLTGTTPMAKDVIEALQQDVFMDGGPATMDLGFEPRTV